MEDNNNIIKIKAKCNSIVFPRGGFKENSDNMYGVVSWNITEEIIGEPIVHPKYGTVTITGQYTNGIEYCKEYVLIAKEVEDKKYGKQYQLIQYGEQYNLDSSRDQRAFLRSFLTANQVKELYNTLDDPIKVIAAHDKDTLKKVRGIGDYIANCIINKYEDNKDYTQLYIELDDYGLTPNFIQKLLKKYKNPQLVIDMVKKKPYRLCYDVDGVGFRTADNIAMRVGIDEKSPERIAAFVQYKLNELGESGNSYISTDMLTDLIYEEFGGKENILEVYRDKDGNVTGSNIGKAIGQLALNKVIGVDPPQKQFRRVWLTKYYELEKAIARELKRLMSAKNKFYYAKWESIISLQENKQGWRFTQEQKEGIKLGLDENVCLVTGGAGCVDCDTEFFTGYGWKKISEYEDGDMVLQYNEDGTAELVNPIAYIKQKQTTLYHFETKYGLDQCLSEEHEVYYITDKGNLYHKPMKKVMHSHQNTKGFCGRFITTFDYKEYEGIKYSDDYIRLKVAVFADGSFYSNATESRDSYNRCRFHIKKDRKKQRLEWLLKQNNINYIKTESAAKGYTDYLFDMDNRDKHFSKDWYKCSKHQREIIRDEVFNWDGRYDTQNEYSTTCKSDADFVQFVLTSLGLRAIIGVYDRRGTQKLHADGRIYERKSIEYTVSWTKRNLIGMTSEREGHTKTPITEYQTKDGYEYCFTVPSHILVLRRNNKIFITGNCGKSSLVSGITETLKKYTIAQCAMAGKASARLAEVTGLDASTIHRLLGYDPQKGGFTYNTRNKLPHDIIILDEISLLGGELFLSLIGAIKDGAKLVILGDRGQLPSIGSLNLANDIEKSKEIPTVMLTKTHRQAQKSGIMVAASRIRESKQLFKRDFEGTKTIGELEDMHFNITSDNETTKERVVNTFKEKFDTSLVHKDIMRIQVLCTMTERGDASVLSINRAIQEFYNPHSEDKKYITMNAKKKNEFIIREGDKVMCVQNSYKMHTSLLPEEDVETDVYNGWIGIVKHINSFEKLVFVYFPIINKTVIFTSDDINTLVLAYACTTHKYQGSSAPCIIAAIDSTTPPQMRTREMIYTMLTRAEKDCTLVGQNYIICECIATSGIERKNTFLQELLDK